MSEKRPLPGDGDEHDPWLRQALQHAPDAAATPPSLLRETILAEARSAVRPARRAAGKPSGSPLLERLDAFWSWLARPPVAAGFASVMAATIVGLMWWDRPMDEAMPPPASSSRVAAPTAPAPKLDVVPPAPLAAPATNAPALTDKATADLSTRRDLQRPAAATATDTPGARVPAPALKTAPVAQAEVSAGKDRDVAVREAEQKTPTPAAAPTTSTRATTPAPFPASPRPAEAMAQGRIAPATTPLEKSFDKKEAAPEALRSAAEPSAMTESAKRADAAPAGAGVANSVSAAKPAPLARQRGATVAREAAADSLDARAPASVPPAAFAAAPPPVRDEAAARERRLAAADASTRPMAPLLAALAAPGERWARRGAGEQSVAVDAASRAWLASVDAAASARWLSAPERAARLQGLLAADSRTLLLSLDGHAAASVRIEDDGVVFTAPSGSIWFAALPADVVARLRATLPAPGR